MAIDPTLTTVCNWRVGLPTLSARLVSLREAASYDLSALVDLLSLSDATRFGIDEPLTKLTVQRLLERVVPDRTTGVGFTYVVTLNTSRSVVGLTQVRQLDPAFEAAEWECTLAPSARGSGVFLETARLVGSFTFESVGAHRLEARVLLENGRANGAMRKLGAVQEGILRRSMRRHDEYLDQVLWSMLKEEWGDHWLSTAPCVH
jgi:RimJ/RimL family protein N-acetyltransferase